MSVPVKRVALLIIFVAALLAGPSVANAAPTVAVFTDPAYVDYSPGDPGAEASNVEGSLQSFGFDVSGFGGVDATAWSSAVAGKTGLMLPENTGGAPLDDGALAAIRNFVAAGGTLGASSDTAELVNAIFGFSLERNSGSCASVCVAPRRPLEYELDPGTSAGTRFADAPTLIPSPSATDVVAESSLPVGGRLIYRHPEETTEGPVAIMPYGAGHVVYLGWDWFDSSPPNSDCDPPGITSSAAPSCQDGGWQEVLRRTFTEPAAAGGPPPTVKSTGPKLSSIKPSADGYRFTVSAPGTVHLRISKRAVRKRHGKRQVVFLLKKKIEFNAGVGGTYTIPFSDLPKGRYRFSAWVVGDDGSRGLTRIRYKTIR